jgi:hypothetical protein
MGLICCRGDEWLARSQDEHEHEHEDEDEDDKESPRDQNRLARSPALSI